MSTLAIAIQKVNALARLPNGWNYGQGRAVRDTTCVRAITVLTTLDRLGISKFDVAPGRDGTATVAGVLDGKEIEIQCRENGRYDLFASGIGTGEVDKDELVFSELIAELGGLNWLPKKSSISFIPGTIYLAWNDSLVKLSKTLRTSLEFPLSASNASGEPAYVYVNTLNDTPEHQYAANRRSFGVLKSQSLQPA